jgi:hypothetical protein
VRPVYYQLTLEERPGYLRAKVVGRAPDGMRLRKIAYVQPLVADPAMPYFAEQVAINRGVNVRLFQNVDAAAAWLSEAPDIS